MPKPVVQKQKANESVQKAPIVQKNRFAALGDSSDEASDVELDMPVAPVPSVSVAPVAPVPSVMQLPNTVDSSNEGEFTLVRGSRGRQIRTDKEGWTKVEWTKPQFVDSDTSDAESTESEVQIKKELEMEALESTDLAYVTDDDLPPPVTEAVPVFSGFMNRGSGINALAWAEKIKQSLDKAETSRKAPPGIQATEDFVSGLTKQTGKLSFFS